MNKLPCACNKERIYTAFNVISRKDVRMAIYKAIMDNRKCTLEDAKRIQVVYKNEVRAVMIALGELEPE